MLTRKMIRSGKREALRQRADVVLAPAFVDERIAPLADNGPRKAVHCIAGIVQARGTGRTTFRYQFNNGVVFYAKAYSDGLGVRAYRTMQHLRAHAFGPDAEGKVADAVAFFEPENLLVMRRAAGVSLDRLTLDGRLDRALRAARAAARWLAILHRVDLPSAEVEPPCERIKIFKLADGLAKAAAAFPQQTPLLLDLLQRVRALSPVATKLVPTHGQYTPANVFVDGDRLTVIDLDRILLSDPAKDVALFAHRVITYLLRALGDLSRAHAVVNAFLDEYESRLSGSLTNLPYYRALFIAKGFAKFAKDRPPDDPARQVVEAAYLGELDSLDGAAAKSSRHARKSPAGGDGVFSENIARLMGRPFADRQLHLALGFGGAGLASSPTVVQNTGTGRVTLRYNFLGGDIIFAKLYSDGLGLHSYRVLQALWKDPMGPGSRFQVCEPLAFLPAENLLLVRAARGEMLASALAPESGLDLVARARQAARWLATLHGSSIRIGEPDPDWESLKTFRLAVRLIKAAAAVPAQSVWVLEVMFRLKELVRRMPARRPVVQTHGRYHHDHVYVEGDTATVIDLDRSRPSDPAKDVAEFVRVMRIAGFKTPGALERATAATNAFLNEYLRLMPDAAAGLAYHWSAFIVLSLLGFMKRLQIDDPRREPLIAFHMQELERAKEIAT